MIFSIVLTASSLTSVVSSSACCASVRTARCTASFASSDFGLNSRLRSAENSSSSAATGAGCCCAGRFSLGVDMDFPFRYRLLDRRLGRLAERFQELRILQHLLDQALGPGLAVHVGDQVLELRTGF